MTNLISTIAKYLEGQKFMLFEGMHQRAIGDFLENETIKLFKTNLKDTTVDKRKKKSLEDFTIKTIMADYLVDVKTTNINGTFSMPNLTAVNKIKKMIDNGTAKYIHYIFIKYQIVNNYLEITEVNVFNLFQLSWRNIQVANLGNGQLQIKDMHKFNGKKWSGSKKEWVQFFKNALTEFYLKRIHKATNHLSDAKAWLVA